MLKVLFACMLPYLTYAQGTSFSQPSCRSAGYSERLDQLQADSRRQTIFVRAQILKADLASCRIGETAYGYTAGSLDSWIRRGDIQCFRNYRGPEDLDKLFTGPQAALAASKIEEWKDCAERLGMAKGQDFRDEYAYAKRELEKITELRKKNCPSSDLQSKPGLGPSRNQGNIGWCAANASADLVSAKLGQKISVVDIGLEYHRANTNLTFFQKLFGKKGEDTALVNKGMWPRNAIEASRKKGYCLEENLRSDERGKESLIELYRAIEIYKKMPALGRDDYRVIVNLTKAVAPKMSESDIITIFRASEAKEVLHNLRDKACEPRLQATFTAESTFDAMQGLEAIHRDLSAGDVPSYTHNIKCSFGDHRDEVHATTITARRWNEQSKSCEFFIRNSWGRNWREGGGIWLDEAQIYKCFHNVTTISRKGTSNPGHAPESAR